MVLEAVGDHTHMRAAVKLEAVGNPIVVQNPVQFRGISARTVLVSDIDRDGVVLAEIENVLIHHGEWRVCCLTRQN